MLCGHNYDILSVAYGYDGNNWIDVGYTKDVASCDPGIGAHSFSAWIIGTIVDKEIINGLKVSYFRDHLAGLQLYFIKLGLNAECYTDYKEIDTLIRPEIRIGDNMFYSKALTRLQVSYGYNVLLSDRKTIERGRHQLTINMGLLIRGWVS